MVKLSPSRVSTALNCSYEYWLKYTRKIPDVKNKGSARGDITHYILENLIRPDRREKVEKILSTNDPWVIPSVLRMAQIWYRRIKILEPADLEKVRLFILRALRENFYEEGAEKVEYEYYFNIETDKYHINGFLDKVAFYSDRIRIRDYKTSKRKFNKEELEFNLQNYFYRFAIWKTFPQLRIDFDFLFLITKQPVQVAPHVSDDEMAGFELWLNQMSDYLTDFNYEKAIQNPGKFNPKCKFWKCGKPLGSINSEGEPAWHCSMRYPFLYYSLEEDGKILKTSRDIDELNRECKEGQKIFQKEYEGCMFHKDEWTKD